jgi:hypothetical protein
MSDELLTREAFEKEQDVLVIQGMIKKLAEKAEFDEPSWNLLKEVLSKETKPRILTSYRNSFEILKTKLKKYTDFPEFIADLFFRIAKALDSNGNVNYLSDYVSGLPEDMQQAARSLIFRMKKKEAVAGLEIGPNRKWVVKGVARHDEKAQPLPNTERARPATGVTPERPKSVNFNAASQKMSGKSEADRKLALISAIAAMDGNSLAQLEELVQKLSAGHDNVASFEIYGR